jgi:hypothetical protein
MKAASGLGGPDGDEVEDAVVGAAVDGVAVLEGATVEGANVEGATVEAGAVVNGAADVAAGGSNTMPNCVRCVARTVAWVELANATLHPSVFHIRDITSQ